MDKGEGIEDPNKERKMMTDELRNGERDNKIKAWTKAMNEQKFKKRRWRIKTHV